MLDPHSRHLYLDELRPPQGYILDRAIGTTFSLDLLALLMTPLSMVLFECQNREELLRDPIAILEALKRTSNRFAIFCQKGRITVPKSDTLLFSYLEKTVVEVQPDNEDGVFHPKTWLLRFTSEDEPVMYRLLCLSRNLTFDRSWDTVLSLEGYVEDRQKAFGRNRPLSDFVNKLPNLAAYKVSKQISEHVNVIGDEILRVRFKPPEGFAYDDIKLIPTGIQGYKKPPKLSNHSRLMIVSPFVSDDSLNPLVRGGGHNVLISREDSLDALGESMYKKIAENTEIYVMSEGAEKPDSFEEREENDAIALDDLTGLHAKLYISEEGWNARVITGSANATRAAFTGRNIEFLVELWGKRSDVGIDSFLGKVDEKTSFRNMIQPYKRPDTPREVEDIAARLAEAIEAARRTISKGEFASTVEEEAGLYSIEIKSTSLLDISMYKVKCSCRPITLQPHDAIDMSLLFKGESISFTNISLASLTSFFVFNITAVIDENEASSGFVLNIPTVGIPHERERKILQTIISDRSRFIRYLLFLLAEDIQSTQLKGVLAGERSDKLDNSADLFSGLPLFEELVKAFSRQPEKIDRIADIVKDISKSDESKSILPEGFELMWGAFLQARDLRGKDAT